MKTSQQWWQEVKRDEAKFINWLKNQYHGERTAATRIHDFAENNKNSNFYGTLKVIANQETKHANWIGGLLKSRGLEASVLDKEERYWEETLVEDMDFKTMCGVASHAEKMRLERIRVIVTDNETPDDIRIVLIAIQKDEEFHATAFAKMAGKQAIEDTKEAHERGLIALGLTI